MPFSSLLAYRTSPKHPFHCRPYLHKFFLLLNETLCALYTVPITFFILPSASYCNSLPTAYPLLRNPPSHPTHCRNLPLPYAQFHLFSYPFSPTYPSPNPTHLPSLPSRKPTLFFPCPSFHPTLSPIQILPFLPPYPSSHPTTLPKKLTFPCTLPLFTSYLPPA